MHRAGWASHTPLISQGASRRCRQRSVETGLERLRAETGAALGDPRLFGVKLDLANAESIAAAAKAIEDAVGAPDVLVHNAGIAAAGMFEDTPAGAWDEIFATNLFGPIALTRALLPSMRAAGRGRSWSVGQERCAARGDQRLFSIQRGDLAVGRSLAERSRRRAGCHR